MLTTHAHRPGRSFGFRKIVASTACALMAALISDGGIRPVAAEDRVRPSYDRRVLSEIARDVLRGGTSGANPSVAEPSFPGGTKGLTPEPEAAAANSEPAEDMVATDIAPAPRGI